MVEALSPYQRRRLAAAVASNGPQPWATFVHPSLEAVPIPTRKSPPREHHPPMPSVQLHSPPSAQAGSPREQSVSITPIPYDQSPAARSAAASPKPPTPTPGAPPSAAPREELIVLPRRVRRVAGGYTESPYSAEELLEIATTAVGWLRDDMAKDLRRLADLPVSQSPVAVLSSVLSELKASTDTLTQEIAHAEGALVEMEEHRRDREVALQAERAEHEAALAAHTATHVETLAAHAIQHEETLSAHAEEMRTAEQRYLAACTAHEEERAAAEATHAVAAAAAAAANDASTRDLERRYTARLRRLEGELSAERRLRHSEASASARTLEELKAAQQVRRAIVWALRQCFLAPSLPSHSHAPCLLGLLDWQAHSLTLQQAAEEARGAFRLSARDQARQAAQHAQTIKAALERLRLTQSELRAAHAMELAALHPQHGEAATGGSA